MLRGSVFCSAWVGLILSLSLGAEAFADDSGCLGEGPLVSSILTAPIVVPTLPGDSVTAFHVSLPVSPLKPDLITAARLQISIERGGFRLRFTFQDPKPLGLPFNLESVQLRWRDQDGAQRSAELDWSDACQSVGRSLFPGQSFETQILADALAGELSDLQLVLHGSRN